MNKEAEIRENGGKWLYEHQAFPNIKPWDKVPKNIRAMHHHYWVKMFSYLLSEIHTDTLRLAIARGMKSPDIDHQWWCAKCGQWIQNDHVTYWETHDPRCGGCDCVVNEGDWIEEVLNE